MKSGWERRLHHHELSSGPLCGLLAPLEFVDRGTFITRDGYLGIIAKLDPPPVECLGDESVDEQVEHVRSLLGGLDPQMRVYQYLVKRRGPVIHRGGESSIPGVADRAEFLERRRPQMFSIEIYLAVVYEVKRPVGIKSARKASADLDRGISIDSKVLRTSVQALLDGMEEFCGGRILDKHEAFAFLHRLVNYSSTGSKRLTRPDDLAWQMGDSNITTEPVLRVGRDFVRVWCLKDLPPDHTTAHLLEPLYSIPSNMIAVTEWKPVPVPETRKRVTNVKTKLSWTKVGAASTLSTSTKPVAKEDLVIDEAKSEDQKELGAVEAAMRKVARFGSFALTVIIHDPDPEALASAAGKVEDCMLLCQGSMTEQVGFGALYAWLSIIPGNSRYSIWTKQVSNENHADMSFVFGPPVGSPVNEVFENECLTVLETRYGTPFYMNLNHAGGRWLESFHTVISGRPRVGKSFLCCHLIEQFQKYDPYTFIFDITKGFELLTIRYGGSYLRLGRRDSKTTINPFSLPETPENIDAIFSLVRMLIEADGNPVSAEELGILHGAVAEVYNLREGRRRLGEMALPSSLRGRLARWIRKSGNHGGESLGFLFDNAEDSVFFSDWTAFEFPQMGETHGAREAVDALVWYISVRCNREIQARSPRPGLIVLDEAWAFIRREDTKAFLVNASKDWPKKNAGYILSTHGAYDLQDKSVRAIIESCVTQIHGANPEVNSSDWTDLYHLSESEVELIRRLAPKREFLIHGEGVVRLYVDPVSKQRFSNSAVLNAKRDALIAEHGVEQGLLMAAGGSSD